ncbi:hypothetical protein G4228_009780 [Cervus hanglu yarkandensis]|nr:hypothetical protein G4228_009780 [Cervus hanglu yarkandensis]
MNARGLGSQLKDSIPVTELSASGPFESHDLLRKGFSCVKNELLPSHPLELSEKNYQDKMNFSTLRNIQGLFAPLKLQMEFKAVQQVQRLPFLPSSNLSLDILRGGNQRELARQKNMKKQSDSVKGKRRDDGLSAAARKQRDSEIMQQKQKKANEKKEEPK